MSIYGLLLRAMPPRAAAIACALFYALLIVTIMVLLPAPPAAFRYGGY